VALSEKQKKALDEGRKKFTTENQPEKNGRKRSKLKELSIEQDLSSVDVSNIIIAMFDKTKEELDIIKSDPEEPFLLRAFVKAMIKDMESDSLYNINTLLDRAIGKAKEKVEHSGSIEMPTINIVSKRK